MANWKVKLAVSGPITIEQKISFSTMKGFHSPFLTNIKVKNTSHGVTVELEARADDQSDANDAAIYFVGQALDYLSLKIRLPLYLSLSGTKIRPNSGNVLRIVEFEEWERCFLESRKIAQRRPTITRALSWYRKAIISEDPVDAFLSYWSSIECLGSKLSRDTPKTRRGVINKICDCFDQLWNNSSDWKVITGDPGKINSLKNHRDGIAHGFIDLNLETIKEISADLNLISDLSHEFITDWERMKTVNERR